MGQHKNNPFANGTSVGLDPIVVDKYGRVLQLGDDVYLHVPHPPSFRIAKMAPAVDPRVPPNHVRVVLHTTLILTVPAQMPLEQLTRIVTQAENIEAGRIADPNAKPAEPTTDAPAGSSLILTDAPEPAPALPSLEDAPATAPASPALDSPAAPVAALKLVE